MAAITYKLRGLVTDAGKSEHYWTCSECGALIGPKSGDKTKHTNWHKAL